MSSTSTGCELPVEARRRLPSVTTRTPIARIAMAANRDRPDDEIGCISSPVAIPNVSRHSLSVNAHASGGDPSGTNDSSGSGGMLALNFVSGARA